MSQPQIARRRPLALVGARLPSDVMPPPLGPIGTARRLIRTIGRAAIAQAYEVGLVRHPRGTLRGLAMGEPAAVRGGRPGAAGRFATIAPARLRADTGRRAVAGRHGHTRRDRGGPAVGAGPS